MWVIKVEGSERLTHSKSALTKQLSGRDLSGSVTPLEVEIVSGSPTSSYREYL